MVVKELDVTTISPRDRHPLIFMTFDELEKGAEFLLTNDHDPKPLYYSFLHERDFWTLTRAHYTGVREWKTHEPSHPFR